jgi:hypothetical protein
MQMKNSIDKESLTEEKIGLKLGSGFKGNNTCLNSCGPSERINPRKNRIISGNGAKTVISETPVA